MTVIPDPGVVVFEIVRRATEPGVTKSDVIRWVGVAVGVAGVVLATPDGIASAWRWTKDRPRVAREAVRRLLRQGQVGSGTATLAGTATTTGRAHAYTWQPWREDAWVYEKINILHQQISLLLEQINELRTRIDQAGDGLRREIREAEDRVVGQIRQLTSELQGERSQASRVDARGLGPIALGIILTGLPDELAGAGPLGWLAVAVAVIWTAVVSPSWWRDYKQALCVTKT